METLTTLKLGPRKGRGVVGRRLPFARIEPVEGGIEVSLFGGATFIPAKAGQFAHPVRVSRDAMGRLITALATFDDPEMEVALDVTDAGLDVRCGTLRRSFPRE